MTSSAIVAATSSAAARQMATLATAGTCPAPAGALAAGEGEVAARVARLLQPVRPLPTAAMLAVCLAAALLVAAPVTLLIV